MKDIEPHLVKELKVDPQLGQNLIHANSAPAQQSKMEWCIAIGILKIGVASSIDQQIGTVRELIGDGKVQGSFPAISLDVHVRAFFNQQFEDIQSAPELFV